MKRVLVTLFLGIVLLGLISFVSATKYDSSGNIVGVCTGTQTCFCSGKAIDCPCNADPCIICGPTSPECTGQTQTGTAQTVNNENTETAGGINTENPQTPGDYVAVLENGVNNLFRTVMGEPSIVGGKMQTSIPNTGERAVALAAIISLSTVLILVIKSILSKLLMAGKPMNAARPSYLQMKIKPPKKSTLPWARRTR